MSSGLTWATSMRITTSSDLTVSAAKRGALAPNNAPDDSTMMPARRARAGPALRLRLPLPLPRMLLVVALLLVHVAVAAFATFATSFAVAASAAQPSPYTFVPPTASSPASWSILWTQEGDGSTTNTFLTSGASLYVHANGKQYSVADGTLQLVSSTLLGAFTDAIGSYNYTQTYWTTSSSSSASTIEFGTHVRVYWSLNAWSEQASGFTPDPTRAVAIVFEQEFVAGALNSGTGDIQGVTSSFPSLLIDESNVSPDAVPKGFFQWSGPFTAQTDSSGTWAPGAPLVGGIRGGPVVLFDKTLEFTAMISPFSQFMATSVYYSTDQTELQIGVMGNASSIPAGFVTETIIVLGRQGIVDTVQGWGDVLRAQYGKQRSVTYSDMAVQYLGYNTDNGAYYYYHTEPSTDYQTTILDVTSYLASISVPIRYLWLDSWWYYKEAVHGGVVNWTAMPSVFPSGLPFVHETIKMPFVAHNRYWSGKNVYATQNGGSYQFIIENGFAAPVEQQFWDDLLGTAATWGLHTYEQDWLYNEFEGVPAFSYDIKLGRTWLTQMAQGAQKNGLTIQYCMSLARHVLQSVELSAVTSMRASNDYLADTDQWRIGDTSIFAHAVGLAPFKDNFWTTSVQPGNPYNKTEPSPDLQILTATLSCGQVTLGDGIGFVNQTLVNRAIRSDGLVLKPDRPAMSLDRTFLARAFGDVSSGLNGNVTYTYTEQNGWRWHTFVVADLSASSSTLLDTADVLPYDASTQTYATYVYTTSTSVPAQPQLSLFDAAHPITVSPCGRTDFQAVYATPVLPNGIVLLGDLSKWVPMSRQRVPRVWYDDSSVSVQLLGVPGENVPLSYALYDASAGTFQTFAAACAIDVDTEATFSVNTQGQATCSTATAAKSSSSGARVQHAKVASNVVAM